MNRGAAIWGDTLYWGTLDAKLLAHDALTGRKLWETTVVENYEEGYALTVAPLVIRTRSLSAPLAANSASAVISPLTMRPPERKSGASIRSRVPASRDTRLGRTHAWKTGGGSIWLTGSYDPELNLTYWGVGNPAPDWNPDGPFRRQPLHGLRDRLGRADTGKLRWHFQFTPHDEWDWDAVQIPVLADLEWEGELRKLMLWGNRNGFFYVLDRETGEFLLGKPFVKQTWAAGLDEDGRPAKIPGRGPSSEGTKTWPGVQGGTNWYAPSFSPVTRLFYLPVWEGYYSVYFKWDQPYEPGTRYLGGSPRSPVSATRRVRFMNYTEEDGYGAVRALDPLTGEKVWDFSMTDVTDSGLLTTASNVLFSGSREGHFIALDATSGKMLWQRYLGRADRGLADYLRGGRQAIRHGGRRSRGVHLRAAGIGGALGRRDSGNDGARGGRRARVRPMHDRRGSGAGEFLGDALGVLRHGREPHLCFVVRYADRHSRRSKASRRNRQAGILGGPSPWRDPLRGRSRDCRREPTGRVCSVLCD